MHEHFAAICPPDAIVRPKALHRRDPGYAAASRNAGLLLRPDSTAMVAAICTAASAAGIGIVPQGGLTGLVDGTAATPDEIALSLARMTRILRIDPVQGVVVAEAGATLQQVNEAAAEHGMMTGIDIPSRGSCTIGGVIATNAGGIRVIRYGMTRDNVLGLTAVLSDGTVLEDMNTLLKNNTGYDLKQLFIGSEGTLGVVTAAVLKLFPRPAATAVALLASPDVAAAQELLELARLRAGGDLMAFEAMWPDYYRLTSSHLCPGREPLPPDEDLKLIIEAAGPDGDAAEAVLLDIFEEAAEAGLVGDGVIAKSQSEQAAMWSLREDSDLVARPRGAILSYDVSIEAGEIAGFVARWDAARARACPQAGSYVFGHLGDCNLHVCLSVTPDEARDHAAIDEVFYGVVAATSAASFSAEHGIGLSKRAQLAQRKPPAMLAAMRRVKTALDPAGVMNPGKVLA
ncbi:FAD-binding oxidoreductase [Paracoccus lutimaris]|uniref:FAD/FMN-containing dehydrogenase n=1 Tax=Paracoccus lutimaris TaxID=1490030 RepID=A0A368Z3S4_9RHOB|nr:FAD-binding oxidoreductase [Paracoccus lutimaris]RCW87112.1 FAD/FMN-containing dehydrogenase [Paracoccus lutimaris]